MKELKWRNWHEWIETTESTWMNWNERIEIKELKWNNWHEWIEMKKLTWMNWNEWIDVKELTWRNWNAWLETHELTWMNWHEWIDMSGLKWVTWHDWLDIKELKWLNWTKWMKLMNSNEWLETNELKRMNWNEMKWMICRPHLEKVVRARQFFAIFMWNRALATVSCTFCRPHLQKLVRTRQVLTTFIWSTTWWLCGRQMKKELSLQSRAHFVDLMVDLDLIFKKWSAPVSVLRFLCEIERLLQSCAHFVDHFPDRGAQPRKQRPSAATTDSHFTWKNIGFCAREFSAVNSRVPDFPTTWWWCDCHDDVVNMMVRQMAVTIVRNSEVS